MARLSTVVLPPLELEDHDLVGPRVTKDFGADRRALHGRSTDQHFAVGGAQQHLVKGHGLAGIDFERGQSEHITQLGPILEARRSEYGVSHRRTLCIRIYSSARKLKSIGPLPRVNADCIRQATA